MRERVGAYRILQRLGGGGMGEVFEAIHEQLERRAAIKFLHRQLCSHPQVAARFLNEARAVNIVRHPSLVDIFELGQLEDGSLYIVMELLEGETLTQRLRARGTLPAVEVTRLARQIAAAVAAAHARGIVHRDLKPDNLMLIADPVVEGGLRVKVLDFGIAKMLGPNSDTPTASLTRTGLILGTPQYMAPEQCRGSRDIDGKADVYSLGLILFEMVAGAPPFTAGNEWELLAMHLQQPAPPLPPSVPSAIASLIGRMLEKDPALRIGMADVASRLMQLHGSPGEAADSRPTLPAGDPQWSAPRTTLGGSASELVAAPPRGGKGRWLGAAALLLAVAGGGAWLHWKTPVAELPPPPPPSPAPVAAAPSPPPPAAMVHWTLTSLPPGASIDSAGGRHLGETPWHDDRALDSGTLEVRLSLAGYRPRTLTLDLAHDEHRQLQLHRARKSDSPPTGESDEIQTVH